MWSDLEESLSNTYKVLSIDLPGFGDNHEPVDSIEAMAEYVIRIMNQNGMGEATVIGHSMGGYVALEMLHKHPNRISALGLFHSNAAADSDEKKVNRRRAIDFLETNSAFAFLKPFSKQLVSERNRGNTALANKCLRLVENTRKDTIVMALKAMMNRADHRSLLPATDTPVLWFIGEEDEFINMADILDQAASTNLAQVEIIPEVGHLAVYEAPEKTLTVIRSFLDWVAEGYFKS